MEDTRKVQEASVAGGSLERVRQQLQNWRPGASWVRAFRRRYGQQRWAQPGSRVCTAWPSSCTWTTLG